jgi:hypothetical protein
MTFHGSKIRLKAPSNKTKKDQTEGSALLKLPNLGTAEKNYPIWLDSLVFIKLD